METSGKKKKANAFLAFMLEYRRNEREKGNDLNMTEVQILAGDIWAKMDMTQRQVYSTKPLDSRKTAARYNSFGVSFEELDRRNAEEKKRILIMEATITRDIQNAVANNGLKDLEFHFFSTSYYVQTTDYRIFPAEIAVSKFSLKEGVFDSLSMLVNPGALPLGYAADATEHSKRTHKRPLPPGVEGETDYEIILSKILHFIGCDESSIPPLYVEEGFISDDFNAAVMTWNYIKKATSNDQMKVQLFPLQHLLMRLSNSYKNAQHSGDKKFLSLGMATEKLSQDNFQYSEIGCQFHVENGSSSECCLSKVRRWGYMLAKHCLDKQADETIEGRHYPLNLRDLSAEVVSTVDNESYWAQDRSGSLRKFDLGSISRRHVDRPILGSKGSFKTVFASTSSFDVTDQTGTDFERSIDDVRKKFPTGSVDHDLSSIAVIKEDDESAQGTSIQRSRFKLLCASGRNLLQSRRIAASLTSESKAIPEQEAVQHTSEAADFQSFPAPKAEQTAATGSTDSEINKLGSVSTVRKFAFGAGRGIAMRGAGQGIAMRSFKNSNVAARD